MADLLTAGKYLAGNPPADLWKIAAQDVYNMWLAKGKDLFLARCGTLCDLTAMSMMMVAAGVKRVEAMKAAINDNREFDSGNGDRAKIYRKVNGAGQAFWDLMIAWAKLPGNGAVQFKFDPRSGAHTFMIERFYLDKIDSPRFRIYQSYEGCYRLYDFLVGDKDDELQRFLDTVGQQSVEAAVSGDNEKTQAVLKKSLTSKSKRDVTEIVKVLPETRKKIGGGAALTILSLVQYVIDPLSEMVVEGAEAPAYTLLTGHRVTNPQGPTYLAVLMCDTIQADNGTLSTNYDEMMKLDGVTGFCGVPLPKVE